MYPNGEGEFRTIDLVLRGKGCIRAAKPACASDGPVVPFWKF
jgi:hypothetical protein